jgi:hypothetical protein
LLEGTVILVGRYGISSTGTKQHRNLANSRSFVGDTPAMESSSRRGSRHLSDGTVCPCGRVRYAAATDFSSLLVGGYGIRGAGMGAPMPASWSKVRCLRFAGAWTEPEQHCRRVLAAVRSRVPRVSLDSSVGVGCFSLHPPSGAVLLPSGL